MWNNRAKPDLLGPLLIGGGLFYWMQVGNPLALVPYAYREIAQIALWVIVAIAGLKAAAILGEFGIEQARFVRSQWPTNAHGSAGWMTFWNALRSGKFSGKGLFLGVYWGLGYWFQSNSHALLVAPSRSGKTTDFIMSNLARDGTSAIITDIKGELYETTGRLRREKFGHRIIGLNLPGRVGAEAAHYNVCDIVVDSIAERPHDALADARAIAKQLVPEPKGGHRDNHFPQGSERALEFTIVSLAAVTPDHCNLVEVKRVVSDRALFLGLCESLKDSDYLEGDLSGTAKGWLSTEAKTPKELQSFLNGAVNALSSYSATSTLGRISQKSTFRFRDVKREKLSVYLGGDMTRSEEITKGAGLWNWAAMTEIQREGNDRPVRMWVDEAFQFKIPNLDAILMGATQYGLRCVLVFQSLASIKSLYDEDSAQSIRGNCDVQIFFGINDWKDAEEVSQALGFRTERQSSFGLTGGLSENQSGHGRALLTGDEVRTMRRQEALVFGQNERPACIVKVGYHETIPLRSQVAVNKLYGSTPFIGTTKLYAGALFPIGIGSWRTWRWFRYKNARLPWGTVLGNALGGMFGLLGGTKPGVVVLGALIVVSALWGVPHVLVSKSGYGCEYVGWGVIRTPGGDCPPVIFKKLS